MKNYFVFICIISTIVSTRPENDNDIIQTPIVGMELTETGFHRNLIYTVQFDYPLAGKECEYVLRQNLPAAVYVSVDQLDDLKRLKKIDAIYPVFVDIEKPTEECNEFEVFIKGVPKITDTLTLPIHYRYHSPNDKNSFVAVDINTPTMFINCPKHEQHLIENELQIDANTQYCLNEQVPNIKASTRHRQTSDRWNEPCNWKFVKIDVKIKSPLRAEIPVGNKNAYPPILYATIIAVLLFFGMAFGFYLRVNISAAIVPMTQPTNGQPYYDWDSSTKSLLLSSFFWGYVIAQIPASMLAKRFGGKIVLGGATAIASIITIFHPLAANKSDWEFVCALRVLVGFTQGVVYPCVHTLLAKWAPRPERGFLATSVYSGAQFGTASLLAFSGSVFDSSMGWPGLYYITGGIGVLWSVIFLIFGADTPRDTKLISKEECEYIEALTGSDQESGAMSIPWKSLFTSVPFYGLIAAHCGFNWGFYTLLTEMPTYMSNVLHLDVKSNALLSALPYFVMWLMCLIVSPISDMLINRRFISVNMSRKLFNSIGQWVPMSCLIALGYMTDDEKTLAIALLTIGVGFNAASFCGYLVNHMDLSPNFAGPMMGITNSLSNLCSICAPLLVGAIVTNEEDPTEWRIVFFITAGVYLVCNLLFVIFGQATVQPWNDKIVTSSTTTLPNNVVQTSITASPLDNYPKNRNQ